MVNMQFSCALPALTMLACIVSNGVSAFGDTFVVNCNPLTIQRSDPIVSPGVPSTHVHAVVGGNAFNRNMTHKYDAVNSKATTCDKKLDHSSYWVPQLYAIRPQDKKFEMVHFNGAAVYYQNRACNYTSSAQYCDKSKVALALPDGLRMVAGDPTRRTQNGSDFSNRAVKMMCMNDDSSIEYYGFPPTPCKTLRAQVYFPSCWTGPTSSSDGLDSPDHKSHMSYPAYGVGANDFDGGVCPLSHPVALLSLFFEFFFNTTSLDPASLVWSNGDTTAFGFHGDAYLGWTNITALQTAHQTCLSPSNCPIDVEGSSAADSPVQGPQPLMYPAVYEEAIGLKSGPISRLAGNNPVYVKPKSLQVGIKVA